MKEEDIWIIIDDLKLTSSEYEVQNIQKMKCNEETRKALAILVHLGILAITWATSVELRLLLKYSKIRPCFIILKMTTKFSSKVLIVKMLKFKSPFILEKFGKGFWPFRGIVVTL